MPQIMKALKLTINQPLAFVNSTLWLGI